MYIGIHTMYMHYESYDVYYIYIYIYSYTLW